jgi:Flp pilus assembly protein TadB
MYGYRPPDPNPEGSWREALIMIRVVFEVLAPPLAILFGTLATLILLVMALFTNPLLALIPAGILGLGVWYLVRRDRKAQEQMQADLDALDRKYR